jgi:peptide/nickel transport system substrate-binding protein
MNKKLLSSLVFFLLLISIALVGCGNTETTGEGQNKETGSESADEAKSDVPQEFTYATTSDIVGLSPILTNDSVSSAAIEQIYETLFTRNPETMEVEPLLAESYESPDQLTWVIKLKEGITFHDGTPFNAEAVKYTFDKFRDPETAAPRASLLKPVESVEVQDEFTVVIKTTEPYGPLLAALSHTNAAIVSPTADQNGDLMKNPVGTGPFKFVQWVSGDNVTLEANNEYWQGAPKLQKVTFKVVPEVTTAVSMLQTGEIQMIDGIQAEHLARLESLNNVEIMKKEGTPVTYLGFNMEQGPGTDLKFRQAVAHAVNREAYVQQLKGLGVKSNSIIGPKVFGYDASSEENGFEFDQEKAKELLAESGYNGETVKMLVANTPVYMKLGEIVQAQLSEVGITAEIETMDWATFLDVSGEGKFDITFLGWTNSTADGSELLYPNLHTDNIGASNRVRYSNPEFDKLVNESRTLVDQEARKQKLVEANNIAIKDAPWVVMSHGIVTAAFDKSVKGFNIDPTGQWSLYSVHRE